MRCIHNQVRLIGGTGTCLLYLLLAATCGTSPKTSDTASTPQSVPDTGVEVPVDSGEGGVGPVDSGNDSSAPTDTAEPPPRQLCPDRPSDGIVEPVELRGSFALATGLYAVPDPFFVPSGMAALIKVKKPGAESMSRIQLFTSMDGLDWDFHEACSIRRGEEGGWSAGGIGTASILKREDAVWVWYRGNDEERIQSIGLTTGAGGCDWSDASEPVFRPSEAWAGEALIAPHVIERDGQLWMYYRGSDHTNQSGSAIGLATSDNGTEWRPHPDNPVVPLPETGWNSSLLGGPHVWQAEERWLMLYSGHDRDTNPEMTNDEVEIGKSIGLAASWDGLAWEDCYDEPLISGAVKNDSPFVWSSELDTTVYYSFTTAEDGSGGELERVTWLDWPSWGAER